MSTRKKIALIGAGNIGGELARALAHEGARRRRPLRHPREGGLRQGQGARPRAEQRRPRLRRAASPARANWADCAGADVVIITAGIPRKPGQSRDDLVATNLPIIRDVADNAKKHCPDAFVIVISNPLDAMVYEFKRRTGLPREQGRRHGRRARQRALLSSSSRARPACSMKDVRAMVLGGHGDDMVPVLSATAPSTASPRPSSSRRRSSTRSSTRTRKGGGEIVKLMGTSAYYAPASRRGRDGRGVPPRPEAPPARAPRTSTASTATRISTWACPCVIGGKGVEKIIELSLTDDEKAMLEKSAESVQSVVDVVKAAS